MKQIIYTALLVLMVQLPVFAKDIYIKTMTVAKKYAKKEVDKLKSLNYDVYTQNYKNLIRVYIGPFNDMKSARESLKKVRQDVVKDAFITRVETVSPKKITKKPIKATDKDIYIKITTANKQYASKEVSRLEKANYSVYTQGYKGLVRVYVGPFTDINKAKNTLVGVKKNIAKDAFITRVKTDLLTPTKKETKPLKVVAITPALHRVKKTAKPQSAVAVTPIAQNVLQTPQTSTVAQAPVAQHSLKPQEAKATSVQEQPPVIQKVEESPKKEVVKEEEKIVDDSEKEEAVADSENEVATAEEEETEDTQEQKSSNKDYFVGISGGIGNVNVNTTGNLALDIDLKDSATSFGVEGGYNFNDSFFMTLNYQYTSLKDFYLHNIYTTLDYRFTKIFAISPYIGVVGGFNTMNWINYPVSSIKSIGATYSYLAGAQLGSDIDISDNFAFYLVYKYWIMDYKTSIVSSTDSKEIDFTSEQNLNFGIKYKF